MRGADPCTDAYTPLLTEPSPRARGRRHAQRSGRPDRGTIPACAGPTALPASALCSRPDHPRMCGADRNAVMQANDPNGPPPHARGRRGLPRLPQGGDGTIPACAGPTTSTTATATGRPGHPRMRGAGRSRLASHISSRGSSPHARGRPRPRPAPRSADRTIPACAGPTTWALWRYDDMADHLRMRGADQVGHDTKNPTPGPSPHARGRPGHPPRGVAPGGTIPACAGPTDCIHTSGGRSSDHPRMRGADGDGRRTAAGPVGPSPHVRGQVSS